MKVCSDCTLRFPVRIHRVAHRAEHDDPDNNADVQDEHVQAVNVVADRRGALTQIEVVCPNAAGAAHDGNPHQNAHKKFHVHLGTLLLDCRQATAPVSIEHYGESHRLPSNRWTNRYSLREMRTTIVWLGVR